MPGLIVFGRRWSTGSDDLVVPGAIMILIHAVLFVIISCIVTSNPEIDQLANIPDDYLENTIIISGNVTKEKVYCARQMRNFALIYLLLLGLATMIEIVLVGFSMQGTILDTKPRKPVEYVLYLRLLIGVIEIVYTIISAIYVANRWTQCEDMAGVNSLFLAIVVIYSLVIIVVLLTSYCVFDPNGRAIYRLKNASRKRSMSISRIERMRKDLANNSRRTWLSRLGCCFCCSSANNNQHQMAMSEASALISDFFRDLDLVPSDILAGLTLLRHKQQCLMNNKTITDCWCRRDAKNGKDSRVSQYMCGRPINASTNFVDLSNLNERRGFEDMVYYCAYALAAYGPMFYIAENCATGVCKLLSECMCGKKSLCCTGCCCCQSNVAFMRNGLPLVRSSQCCGWGLAGVRRSLREHGISEENVEVVYVSWENEIYKQPFYMCVDHDKKTIVVTVRGTIGEADALTDLITNSADIPAASNDGTWKGHKGMVESAQYIKRMLVQQDMVLSQGFGRDLLRGTRDYDLVLVGHSLGAGVVAILSLMLQDEYPSLKCYAYSPPGGLLSFTAMEASRHRVSSIVLGKDVVTRLGLPQMERLRNEIIHLLKHSHTPKFKLILGSLFHDSKHRHKLLKADKQSTDDLKLAGSLQSTLVTSGHDMSIIEEMFPPGRLFHIVYDVKKNYNGGLCSSRCSEPTVHYYVVEADNTSDFDEIIVSNSMISHHMPHKLFKAMKKVLKSPSELINRSYSEAKTLPSNTPLSPNNPPTDSRRDEAAPQHPHPDVVMETLRHADNGDNQSDYSSNTESSIHDDSEPLLVNERSHLTKHELTPSTVSPASLPPSSSIELPPSDAPLARPDSFSETESACSPDSVKVVISKAPTKITTIAEVNSAGSTPPLQPANSNNNNSSSPRGIVMSQPQASSTPIDHDKQLQSSTEDEVFEVNEIAKESPAKPTSLSLTNALLSHGKSTGDVTSSNLELPPRSSRSASVVERSGSMVDNFREYLDHVLSDPRKSIIEDSENELSDEDVKIMVERDQDSINHFSDNGNVSSHDSHDADGLRISLPTTPGEEGWSLGRDPKTPTSVKSCNVGSSNLLPRARFEPNLIPKPPRSFSSARGDRPKNIKVRKKLSRRHSASTNTSIATM